MKNPCGCFKSFLFERNLQFELMERKRARLEYEKMLFRQEMEGEELRMSSESALKELQQLQVSLLSNSNNIYLDK